MGITKSEFEGWVENSRNWASRFDNFKFKNRLSLPSKFYPSNTLEHLESLIEANGRMDYSDPVKMQRVKDEIELLHSNGVVDLLPYFFAQEDVLSQYEKAKELVGPGRGSAAGLYISYLLNITHVDPLRYELSKDRFLTKDRILSGKLPDIDVDLPSRDLLVGPNGDAGYLKERFGDHFAQISNDNTLRIKSSIKDVYRALHGNVPWEIEKLCKQIPIPPQGVDDHKFVFGYEGDDGPVKGIAETDPALKAFIAGYPKEWAVVVKCLGITRNKGRHASAFVLANEPVANFLPLIEVGGTICTAYDHRSVESAGGLKMDYLVIHVLNDIAGCIKLVQTRHTPDVDYTKDFTINGLRVPGFRVVPTPEGPRDIWDLPGVVDVFNDICSGKVATVFQFDTPGVTKWMKYFSKPKSEGSKELGLSSIEDLAAFTALDRPGPLDAEVVGPDGDHRNMLVEFASRTQGGDPYGAIEELDRLLPETKGVMVYQEQLTKIFRVLGKTTALEAEAFREHVSKKKMELVLKDKSKFMAGAGPSLGEERANLIWDQMVTFARYGFNKSHAISYVCIAYATAYLKHFYNLEWWTSVLANAKSRNEINEKFWSHVQNLVLLPDVKYSKGTFVIEGDKIRAPLSLLEGVGEAAHLEIVKNAPYENIADFVNKIEQGRVARGTEVQTTKKKKIKKVDGTVETVSVPTTTFKKGRTAINKTVISNLIISGVADGLFPPDTDIFDKMQLYEQARAVATGTKPKPIPPALLKYTPLMRYQVRKKLLQGWSGSLLKVFLDSQVPQITKNERGTYIYRGIWPFVTPDFIDYLETLPLLPKRQNFCVAAYVVSERKFTYQGDKTACELILDVSGRQMKMVKWPDYNSGKLPVDFNEDLTNALVVVMLSKWKLGRDPSVEGLTVVQRPIDTVVFEEESENNEPN
jgi:DNA polymerase III alpha subunit